VPCGVAGQKLQFRILGTQMYTLRTANDAPGVNIGFKSILPYDITNIGY